MKKSFNGNGQTLQDVYLCGTRRHLLMALASILQSGEPATLIYLEDRMPVPADMRARMTGTCPNVTFIYTKDTDQIAAFARLPRVLPAIIRRNLSIGGRTGIIRPDQWPCPAIGDQVFATSYVYHSVFFMAKVLAGRSNQTVLREDGLGNYVGRPVAKFKSLLRWCSGLVPRTQIFGEEKWVARIEVSRPQNLPEAVRAKGVQLSFAQQMDNLPAKTARALGAIFLTDVPELSAETRTAILLTQPIDAIGICSTEQKNRVYAGIAARVMEAGYAVYIKPHPTEALLTSATAMVLPPDFPVEVWPYLTEQKFTLAVALCSASLAGDARAFSQRSLQLLSPAAFNAEHFHDWAGLIDLSLDGVLVAATDSGKSVAGTA